MNNDNNNQDSKNELEDLSLDELEELKQLLEPDTQINIKSERIDNANTERKEFTLSQKEIYGENKFFKYVISLLSGALIIALIFIIYNQINNFLLIENNADKIVPEMPVSLENIEMKLYEVQEFIPEVPETTEESTTNTITEKENIIVETTTEEKTTEEPTLIITDPPTTIESAEPETKEKVKTYKAIKDVSASSTFSPQPGYVYYPSNAVDSNISTCWVEGAEGNGAGEWITLYFYKDEVISGIDIWNGYCIDQRRFDMNNRVKMAELEFSDGTKLTIYLADVMDMQTITFNEVETSYLKLIIKDTYNSKDDDTCISEIKIFGME